jgi:hypothetical protein
MKIIVRNNKTNRTFTVDAKEKFANGKIHKVSDEDKNKVKETENVEDADKKAEADFHSAFYVSGVMPAFGRLLHLHERRLVLDRVLVGAARPGHDLCADLYCKIRRFFQAEKIQRFCFGCR